MKIRKLIIYFFIILFLLPATFSFAADDLDIHSESCILIDSNTGKILYSKASDSKMYPASTTKILTAILTIEKCNLDDMVVINKTGSKLIPEGYVSANLLVGEELSIDDLLKMLLIPSANDVAIILAEHISGSVESFSNLMNEKATEIGCKNTHFVNPNGIHNENHYTTAYDLSMIAKYCMKNQSFRNYVSMSSVRKYANTNDLIKKSSKYYISDCVGIKTGHTTEAKNCLVSAFKKDGLDVIAVTLGGDILPNGDNARFVDGKTLYNYTYSTYSIKTIAKQGDVIQNYDVKNGTKDTKNLDLILNEDLTALAKNDEQIATPEININEPIKAPITQGQKLGTATFKVNGEYYTKDLLASHDVKKDYFIIIVVSCIGGIVLLIIIIIIIKKRHRNKKRRH